MTRSTSSLELHFVAAQAHHWPSSPSSGQPVVVALPTHISALDSHGWNQIIVTKFAAKAVRSQLLHCPIIYHKAGSQNPADYVHPHLICLDLCGESAE